MWFHSVIVAFPASGSVLQEYMWFQSVIVSFPASVSVTGIHVVSVCHRQFSGFSVSERYRNMWFRSVTVRLRDFGVSVTFS